jgi:putative ABC transport system ATP-binding protein
MGQGAAMHGSISVGAAHAPEAALILVRDVERRYVMGTEVVSALSGVSFAIDKGEFVAIVGSSGSGKSTLMNILGCLDTPSAGRYALRGRDVKALGDDELSELRNREIGFVFQSFQLLPRQSALANVELPLVYRGIAPRERQRLARRALERVGLGHRLSHKPTELSGGQRQRVSIARALVAEPSLLLADEPTGNLDSATGREILAIFAELHAAGNTIVLVTHEPAVAAACPRAIRLSDGRIVEDVRRGPTKPETERLEPATLGVGERVP